MLRLVKMYHFGDACVCVFVKDFEDDRFISKMKELFMVFKDHVVQLHDIQNLDKEKVKKAYQEIRVKNKQHPLLSPMQQRLMRLFKHVNLNLHPSRLRLQMKSL